MRAKEKWKQEQVGLRGKVFDGPKLLGGGGSVEPDELKETFTSSDEALALALSMEDDRSPGVDILENWNEGFGSDGHVQQPEVFELQSKLRGLRLHRAGGVDP